MCYQPKVLDSNRHIYQPKVLDVIDALYTREDSGKGAIFFRLRKEQCAVSAAVVRFNVVETWTYTTKYSLCLSVSFSLSKSKYLV